HIQACAISGIGEVKVAVQAYGLTGIDIERPAKAERPLRYLPCTGIRSALYGQILDDQIGRISAGALNVNGQTLVCLDAAKFLFGKAEHAGCSRAAQYGLIGPVAFNVNRIGLRECAKLTGSADINIC